MRSIRRCLAAALVAAAALGGAAQASQASPAAGPKALVDKASGFSIRPPSGYRLSVKKNLYTVSGPAGKIVIEEVATSRAASAVGAEILHVAGGKTRVATSTAAHFLGSYSVKGQGRTLEVTRHARVLVLATYLPVVRRGASAHIAGLTPLDTLRRIAATAAGGRAITPAAPLPLRPFTTADGGASANVPAQQGWSFGGSGGVVEGLNPAVGVFAFGLSFPVTSPTSVFANQGTITAPFTTPAASMSAVLPAFFRSAGVQLDSVTATATFPGSDQVLGAPYTSGFFTVTASAGGHPLTGVVLFGGAPDPRFSDGSWLAYTSYVLVSPDVDPRVGAALLSTWGSWNPSVDQSRRTAATLHTILTTNVGGGPIDPDVFAAASADWDAYLRE